MVQEVPSPSRNLLNPRGIPTTPKSSTSAGMSLNYLLRTKESRCSLGRPPQRVEQNAHPLTARHPAFENSSRPILNLISTIRSKYSVSEMQKMAYRLRRETTVVATQEAMGSVEEVYRTVFRDTRSRPTFLIGVTSHGFWESAPNASNSSASIHKKNTLQGILIGQRVNQTSFTAVYAGFGSIKLGPLALSPNTESPESVRKRELTAQYLINTLIACTPLNASRVNQGASLYRRLQKAVRYSVIGPLSALQECKISAVFDDDKWRQIGLDLIKEAWLVIRHDLRGLTLQKLNEWVMGDIHMFLKDIHPALIHVMYGRSTDIEKINGWFVESGKLHKPPVHCITHQAMIDAVQAKTEKIKRQFELKALEERAKSEKKKGGPHQEGSSIGSSIHDGLVEFDRVEVIRMRKEKAQKALLGNQPMPERITSPSILPLGNSKLRIR